MEPCYTSVAVLLVLSLLAVFCSGQCRFEYRTQPPSSIVYDCNPYRGNTVRISLGCVVRWQINVTDNYKIRWFRQNTTGGVEDLGRGNLDEALDNDWLSRYRITELLNQQYNSSFAGKYWCQVINTTADPDQPLIRSNVFTLLPPDNYMHTAPTCFRALTLQQLQVFNVTCADLKVHSETVTDVGHTTTTLAAALTPSITTTSTTTTTCGQTGTWVYIVIAVLGVVIVTTSVVAVLLLLRKQRQNRNHQNHQKGKCDAVKQQTNHFPTNNTGVVKRSNIRKEVWQIKKRSAGSVTEGTHPTPPLPPHPPPHASDHHSSTSSVQHYQPLNIVNTDYTTMYATPTNAGRKGTPLMEVEGNMYFIVDPTTRKDEHTYTTPQ